MPANNTTDWNINTDIYSILESVQNVQRRYIDDEDETTLSLGPFGFLADTEAKKIQTQTIMAGQLGNEMFPSRARLTKNILAHATYNGITDINAVPAHIMVTLCIKTEDIDKWEINDKFYLDSDCPIYIGKYEFHLDYDVVIKRALISETDGKKEFAYSAQYITEENGKPIVNRLADIINPYLRQPFMLKIGQFDYVAFQVVLRQYTIEETRDTMVSDSIIENKSYTFEFDNQIADFRVIVTDNGVTTELTPYIYGSTIDPQDPYCWYLYTSEGSVRITFDSRSYIPGLSSDIYIKAFTTLGAGGNFEYLGVDQTSEGLYVDVTAKKYNYKNVTAYLVAVEDSVDGADRKSKDELKELIPKAAMSRGSITTETDLNNYFNLINTDVNRLVLRKKEDNQLNRVWYCYFVMKDDNNNIIPSNTVRLKVPLNNSSFVTKTRDGRYMVAAGTYVRYRPDADYAEFIDEARIPEEDDPGYFDTGYYYYMLIYNIVITASEDPSDPRPLYSAHYMAATNHDSYFLYEFVQEEAPFQFIANRFHFKRNLIVHRKLYKIWFAIAQSILDPNQTDPLIFDSKVVRTNSEGISVSETVHTENLKVVLVIYRDGIPYRWKEMVYDPDPSISKPLSGIYGFELYIETDDQMDDSNRIKIMGMHEPGTDDSGTIYGFVDETAEARIYILASIPYDTDIEYPRKDLDDIAPGVYKNYIVTNIYSCATGLDFFSNMTNITNTKTEYTPYTHSTLYVSGVPVIGRHYVIDDINMSYVMESIKEKKAYIENCLKLVENSLNVDFKFFNTYGHSKTLMLEDKETSIGDVDISMKFKLSLKDSTDITTSAEIVQSIKAYIENLNNTGDLHIPNLITDIITEYQDRIYFIEYVGFNAFGTDDQHIIEVESDDPYTVPEFINVRNIIDYDTGEFVPAIEIILV